MRKFFKLVEDIYIPNRWYPGKILDVDNWAFSLPRPVAHNQAPFELTISQDGDQTDYSQAGSCAVHIGNDRVVEILSKYKKVEFFPLLIKKPRYKGNYHAIKVHEYLDCLDESQSEFQVFTENDPIRPDLAGQYHSIITMRIDVRKISDDTHIFRLSKDRITLIVSENIKIALEKEDITGCWFIEV